MDGTLVDTEPYWIECEYELVESFGGTWSAEHAHAIVGFDLRDAARYILDHSPVDLPVDEVVERLLDGVVARVRRRVPWQPGARELLAALRRAQVPCALVTMSWRRFADAVIEALPPGSFDVVVAGDEVAHGKPHPEPYLTAATRLGVSARQCIAIEDSPTGTRSAIAAGCLVYAVPNVVNVPPSRKHTRLDSLLHLDLRTMYEAMAARARGRARRRQAIAALVVAALVAGVTLAWPSTDPPPPSDIPIDAWAPYWVLPAATASVETYGALLRDVSPFWYEARGATDIGRPDTLAPEATEPFVAAATQHDLRIVPSIVDAMPAGGMAAVLADATTRTEHVNTIIALVQANDYAGIDLDYEQFVFADGRGTWEDTRPNWVAFVTELADGLHADGRTLTVSVPPIYNGERQGDSGYWVYDYAAMGDVVDRIRIMAYDYSVSEPGPIAPIDWVAMVIDAAKEQVDDHDKLVLGVGLYGRNWVVTTRGACPTNAEATVPVTHASLDELIERRGVTPVHDPVTGEASFEYELIVNDGTLACTQVRRVHIIDVEGVRLRIDLARTEGLGGASLWALGFDDAATWKLWVHWPGSPPAHEPRPHEPRPHKPGGAMSITLQRAAERFHTDIGWLDSKHSFNFGEHWSPEHNGHGLLLVNNDDIVAAGGGFGTHGHRDMEIVTWVLSGSLEHRDSEGNEGVIYPGLAQRMSAGRGIRHSEMNHSESEPVHFVQMWVLPDTPGVAPGYEQLDVNDALDGGALVPVASGRGHPGTIAINQRGAVLWAGRLPPGADATIPSEPRVHVFVALGSGSLEGAGSLSQGDSARLTDAGPLVFTAGADGAELLVWATS